MRDRLAQALVMWWPASLRAISLTALLIAPAPSAPPVSGGPSTAVVTPLAAAEGWQRVLDGPLRVLRPFDPPTTPWGPGHRGVDLAASPGQAVHAAAAGRVEFAGVLAGRGVVSVTHGALRTTYLPVRPLVRRGQPVRAGEVIGTVAPTPRHCARQACLHWGLLAGDRYLDPLGLLAAGQVRLLPVWGVPEP